MTKAVENHPILNTKFQGPCICGMYYSGTGKIIKKCAVCGNRVELVEIL